MPLAACVEELLNGAAVVVGDMQLVQPVQEVKEPSEDATFRLRIEASASMFDGHIVSASEHPRTPSTGSPNG